MVQLERQDWSLKVFNLRIMERHMPQLQILLQFVTAAIQRKIEIYQIDVETTFLNGHLREEMYLKPQNGLYANGEVLQLKKALYGLKQAPHYWYSTIIRKLLENGFQ